MRATFPDPDIKLSSQAWRTFVPSGGQGSQVNPMVLVFMFAFLVIVIASVICVTQAQRKISVSYAKRVVGQKVYGGQTQYMPLKVNYAGVMPIIFAQALLVFPSTIATMAFKNYWRKPVPRMRRPKLPACCYMLTADSFRCSINCTSSFSIRCSSAGALTASRFRCASCAVRSFRPLKFSPAPACSSASK